MSISIQRKQVWLFSMFVMLSVAFNSDWKASSPLWWGSVIFFIGTYAFYRRGKIELEFTRVDCWLLGFISLSAISIVYAMNIATVIEMLKTLVVILVLCYVIGKEIKDENDANQILFVTLLSLFVVAIYLYTTVDLNSFILTRVGQADTGRWNANDIGIMSSVGIMIGLTQLRKVRFPKKLIIVATIVLFAYLTVIMASRKALIMLVVGLCGMRVLNNPTKLIRNILLIVIGLCLAWYMILEIPFFYELIGWRMEGMVAAIKGETGTSDSSSLYRAMMLKAAFDTFKANPIFGVGMDNFRFFNPIRTTYAHNNFAEIAADLGILGIIGYYWIFVCIIADFVQTFRQHDTEKNFLFIVVMVYLINHVAMVTVTDLLQYLFIFVYVSYSQKKKCVQRCKVEKT